MSKNNNKPEKMDDFFTARLDMYEDHMLTESGIRGYEAFAELIPADTKKLLDLGCGTGLELDYIFKRLPDIRVTGIDMTQSMLDQLKHKYPNKDMRLICGNYLDIELGESIYDTVISFQTMHHLLWDQKVEMYRNILRSLQPGGIYIEADFTAQDQPDEDERMSWYRKLKKENDIADGEPYHLDIPFTVENRIKMFEEAGFSHIELVYRREQPDNTAIISASR